MLLPPTRWPEGVSGGEQWLVCRCSESIPHCSCLLLQPVCGSACAKTIRSLLCPKHSCLVKDILASHETHMHSTLFWSVLAPPCLDIVPWCWLLPMLVWLQDLLHLAEPLQVQTWSFCKAHPPPFFLFLLLHALLLNNFKFPWMLSVPESAVMFKLHAIVWGSRNVLKKLLCVLSSVGKHTLTFLSHTGPLHQFLFGSLQH